METAANNASMESSAPAPAAPERYTGVAGPLHTISLLLILGAWARRHRLRLADALYVELATTRGWRLVTTDRRLHDIPAADVVHA